MNMTKSLILGSAAALLAMGGAQAADLPLKAKAVEYVRICSLYGAGFYYMPGTDTCIKLGGYVRADVGIMGGDYGFMQGANQGSNNRLTSYWNQRSRFDLTVDTRTATEYGVVRTYADTVFTVDSSNPSGSNPSAYTAFNTSATTVTVCTPGTVCYMQYTTTSGLCSRFGCYTTTSCPTPGYNALTRTYTCCANSCTGCPATCYDPNGCPTSPIGGCGHVHCEGSALSHIAALVALLLCWLIA